MLNSTHYGKTEKNTNKIDAAVVQEMSKEEESDVGRGKETLRIV